LPQCGKTLFNLLTRCHDTHPFSVATHNTPGQ